MFVALFSHPAGAGEMALSRTVGTGGVARGIDVQDDARDLGPVGAISFRIKDSQIGDEVFHVVAGEPIYVRNLVSTVRIERWPRFDHGDILRAVGGSVPPECGATTAGVNT
jgi:hypothetical protein